MAELHYVDWDGLVYYDGKIKAYLNDKFVDSLKYGGAVTAEEIPSPSAQNINYLYKVTTTLITTPEYFIDEPGYEYAPGTLIQVVDVDGRYLYTVFNEPISVTTPDGGSTDLTDIINRLDRIEKTTSRIESDVENIEASLVTFATKEETSAAIKEAVESIEPVDLSSYAKIVDVEEQLSTKANLSDIPDVTSFVTSDDVDQRIQEAIDNIQIPTTDGFVTEETLEILVEKLDAEFDNKADKPIVEDLLTDVSVLQTSVEALQEETSRISELESQISTKADLNEIPDVSQFVTESEVDSKIQSSVESLEIPSVDGLATESFVIQKIAEAQLSEGEGTLADYVSKSELTTMLNEYVTNETLESKNYVSTNDLVENYITKEEISNTYVTNEALTPLAEKVEAFETTYVTTQAVEELVTKKIEESEIIGTYGEF